jgi:predicted NUDIX family NTP pyrophosphohydrolase
MKIESYGILLYREVKRKQKSHSNQSNSKMEVFLIKPNGPHFWGNPRMSDIWGIPKGRKEAHEKPLEVAHREFYEEVGVRAPVDLNYQSLPPLVTFRGKVITIFSADATGRHIEWQSSNNQSREWPLNSGRQVTYSETIAGAWFPVEEALKKIGSGQRVILQHLLDSRDENQNLEDMEEAQELAS